MSTKQETKGTPRVDPNPMAQIAGVFEPWIQAASTWVGESERMQAAAIDGFNKALDNSHRMAKETLAMVTSMNATMQKQWNDQVRRTVDFFQSFGG